MNRKTIFAFFSMLIMLAVVMASCADKDATDNVVILDDATYTVELENSKAGISLTSYTYNNHEIYTVAVNSETSVVDNTFTLKITDIKFDDEGDTNTDAVYAILDMAKIATPKAETTVEAFKSETIQDYINPIFAISHVVHTTEEGKTETSVSCSSTNGLEGSTVDNLTLSCTYSGETLLDYEEFDEDFQAAAAAIEAKANETLNMLRFPSKEAYAEAFTTYTNAINAANDVEGVIAIANGRKEAFNGKANTSTLTAIRFKPNFVFLPESRFPPHFFDQDNIIYDTNDVIGSTKDGASGKIHAGWNPVDSSIGEPSIGAGIKYEEANYPDRPPFFNFSNSVGEAFELSIGVPNSGMPGETTNTIYTKVFKFKKSKEYWVNESSRVNESSNWFISNENTPDNIPIFSNNTFYEEKLVDMFENPPVLDPNDPNATEDGFAIAVTVDDTPLTLEDEAPNAYVYFIVWNVKPAGAGTGEVPADTFTMSMDEIMEEVTNSVKGYFFSNNKRSGSTHTPNKKPSEDGVPIPDIQTKCYSGC